MDFPLTKSFKYSDFACRCGGKHRSPMSLDFVFKLQKMQDILGDRFDIAKNISSAFRCDEHNKRVNGSKGSLHRFGRAVDIRTNNSAERFILVKAAMDVGMGDISLAYQFIHVDDRDTKQMRMY